MPTMGAVFDVRRSLSGSRLAAVRDGLTTRLATPEPPFIDPGVCIYATGSLARREMTENSDLDAFFLLSASKKERPLSRIREVKILNCVVQVAEETGFPDFSNDGEYLSFLHIDDVCRHIGGREDDYQNALTARMLMLLESEYLYNEELYKQFKKQLVDVYFDDFHDHSKSFRPIFLLNDVLRFWRTMCLNYENGRQWRTDDAQKRAKGHLANLKLKFSRLNICFSFIAHLLNKGHSLTPEDVIHTSSLSPIERLLDLAIPGSEMESHLNVLLEEYAWFLDAVGDEKEKVLGWISIEEKRNIAFSHAHRFVEVMGDLVGNIATKQGYLRYMIV